MNARGSRRGLWRKLVELIEHGYLSFHDYRRLIAHAFNGFEHAPR